MKSSLLTLVFSLFLIVPLVVAEDKPKELEHTKDTLEEVKKRVEDKKAVLVDVRELVEWNKGRVAGAVHLPWRAMQEKPDDPKIKEKLEKGMIVYTYCEVGYRSLKAGAILNKLGYEIRPLKPGYQDLIKAGFKKEE
jgi:phage shock protein E